MGDSNSKEEEEGNGLNHQKDIGWPLWVLSALILIGIVLTFYFFIMGKA
jgi:hypothetical protein